MSPKAVREITQQVPTLRDHWVAVDTTPHAQQSANAKAKADAARGKADSKSSAPVAELIALESGAVVVDADEELDALCSRLSDAGKTSLTIVYVD